MTPRGTFQAVYFRANVGSEPVREFIDSLSPRAQEAIMSQIALLNRLTDNNPHLPFPHSSQVDGDLRELRCHFGSQLYRILYFRSHRLIVLVHIFHKTSGRIPPREIEIAIERVRDFKRRMRPRRRRELRAAGGDAP